jgi:hypothetical protein
MRRATLIAFGNSASVLCARNQRVDSDGEVTLVLKVLRCERVSDVDRAAACNQRDGA